MTLNFDKTNDFRKMICPINLNLSNKLDELSLQKIRQLNAKDWHELTDKDREEWMLIMTAFRANK